MKLNFYFERSVMHLTTLANATLLREGRIREFGACIG
jgi:hypothetical protein